MNIIYKRETDRNGRQADYGRIITSIPAAKRTILYGNQTRFLSFPSMVFMAVFEEPFFHEQVKKIMYLSVGFTPEFNGDQTKLYLPPLPNMARCGTACLGNHFWAKTPEELIQNVISYFWSSSFVLSGLNEAQDYYCGSKIFSSLSKWAEYTKLNPDWIPQPDQLHGSGSHSDITLANWAK